MTQAMESLILRDVKVSCTPSLPTLRIFISSLSNVHSFRHGVETSPWMMTSNGLLHCGAVKLSLRYGVELSNLGSAHHALLINHMR